MTARGARVLLAAVACAAGVAACGKDAATPVATRGSLADSADQVMFKLRTTLTDDGVMKARLEGDSGFFFDENTRVELRGVRTVFFSSTGAQTGVLTSRQGTYNTRAGVMEARRNVEVVTTDGKRLVSPALKYEQYRNVISTDSPFVFTEAAGKRVEGIGFESDPQMLNVKIKRFGRGTGGSVMLPAARGEAGAGQGMILRADTTRPAVVPAPASTPDTGRRVPPPAGAPTP